MREMGEERGRLGAVPTVGEEERVLSVEEKPVSSESLRFTSTRFAGKDATLGIVVACKFEACTLVSAIIS